MRIKADLYSAATGVSTRLKRSCQCDGGFHVPGVAPILNTGVRDVETEASPNVEGLQGAVPDFGRQLT